MELSKLKLSRIYIIPTAKGAYGFASGFLMILISTIYQANTGYMLAFILLSFLFIILLANHSALAKLDPKVTLVEPYFAGQLARVQFSEFTEFEIVAAKKFKVFKESLPTLSPHLEFTPPRRGEYTVEPAILRTNRPFGFFKCWKPLGQHIQIFVAPNPLESPIAPPVPIALANSIESGLAYGHREQIPGDSMRWIDWKKFAQPNRPFVRETEDEQKQSPRLEINIMDYQSLPLEEKLSHICFLVRVAQEKNMTVILIDSAHSRRFNAQSGHEFNVIYRYLSLYGEL